MLKSYNGLSALVKRELGDNPLSGEMFVFVNRKRTQMKILYFDGDGYALWCKRLAQGLFVMPDTSIAKKPLNYAELQCLLYGIDWQNARRFKRFALPQGVAS
ncbi:IS66 family insertion sequence element accessory protein TnpB [bacterium]|nr:IS66 family insertion sequence element accessory protein TnpB [bacterium]